MDPNATLSVIRATAQRILDGHGSESLADVLAGACADMDGWLSRGGYLPSEWGTVNG